MLTMKTTPWRVGLLGFACLLIGQAENWPGFRGPRGDGTSTEAAGGGWRQLWKIPLPGPGHSSPVVWNDRVCLTAFEPEQSLWGALMGRRGRLLVLCFDKSTGKLRWQREVPTDGIARVTSVNQPASPTPVTDGKSLFVYFGSCGLLAFDFEGNLLWEHKLGPFPHHMGVGSSPVLLEDKVLLNVETDGPAFLLAVAKKSGETIWQVRRKVRQAGYSSPFVWRRQIIVAATNR
jgi:outer membrane protein assembly factor BamB